MSISIGAPLHSIRTILFFNRNASFDKDVLQYIQNAESIFFEGMFSFINLNGSISDNINSLIGGDQSRYLKYWSDTPVQSIIQSKLCNITVGGTSAGLAILGIYIALA
jgi:cyanophycinase